MADLKTDLLQEVGRKKYLAEMELVRLANDGNINYEHKLKDLATLMGEIAVLNAQGELINQYFQEAQPEGGEPEGEPVQPEGAPEQPEADNVVEAPAKPE